MLFCFIIHSEPLVKWFRIMHYPLSFWLLVAQLAKQALRYKIPQSRLAWSCAFPLSFGDELLRQFQMLVRLVDSLNRLRLWTTVRRNEIRMYGRNRKPCYVSARSVQREERDALLKRRTKVLLFFIVVFCYFFVLIFIFVIYICKVIYIFLFLVLFIFFLFLFYNMI